MGDSSLNNLGTELSNLYNNISNSYGTNSDYSTTSTSSIINLINAINSNLELYDFIENELILTNNSQTDTLIKQQQLIQLENEELMEQLEQLQQIQSNIQNKNVMIEQVNANISNEQNNVNVLIVSIVCSVVILLFVMLYGYNVISKTFMLLGSGVVVLVFVFVFMYIYNIFFVNTGIKNLMNGNMEAKMIQAIQDFDVSAEDLIENQKWVNNNCNCGTTAEEEEESQTPNYNYSIEQPGYYYYDGSAPPQVIVPSPPVSGPENITWVDYDSNSFVPSQQITPIASTNPSNNTTVYSTSPTTGTNQQNTNYYNYNTEEDDPRTSFINAMDNTNTYVNSNTVTNNL